MVDTFQSITQQAWDLRALLGLENPDRDGKITCVGHTKYSSGRRCRNTNAASDFPWMNQILRRLQYIDALDDSLLSELRELASWLLCRHQASHACQADSVAKRWFLIIQREFRARKLRNDSFIQRDHRARRQRTDVAEAIERLGRFAQEVQEQKQIEESILLERQRCQLRKRLQREQEQRLLAERERLEERTRLEEEEKLRQIEEDNRLQGVQDSTQVLGPAPLAPIAPTAPTATTEPPVLPPVDIVCTRPCAQTSRGRRTLTITIVLPPPILPIVSQWTLVRMRRMQTFAREMMGQTILPRIRGTTAALSQWRLPNMFRRREVAEDDPEKGPILHDA